MYLLKIKKICIYGIILVMALCWFSGCDNSPKLDTETQKLLEDIATKDDAIIIDNAEAMESKVRLTNVIRGDLLSELTVKAEFYYPIAHDVFFELGEMGAVFVEYLCSVGDFVQKGDPIASIEYNVNHVELEKMKLNQLNTVNNYKKEKSAKRQRLDEQRSRLESLSDPDQIAIESIHLSYLEEEYSNYIESMEEVIADIDKSIKEYEEKMGVCYIYTPVSGVITETSELKRGSKIYNGHFCAKITSMEEEPYLVVENEHGAFRYNMKVDLTVTDKDRKGTETLKGRVVSELELTYGPAWYLAKNYAVIELLEGDMKELYDKTVRATCYPRYMKDVLLVSKDAVSLDASEPYVMVQTDEGIYKKKFVSGGANDDYYFVFDGLEEGITVLID